MPNDLAVLVPTILKHGLLALRQYAVMPRLVNTDYANEVAEKGHTINVVVPSSVAAIDVVPGTYPAGSDILGATEAIVLNNWKESAFRMTDKEIREIDDKGTLVGQSSEALKSVCNAVDASLVNSFRGFYSTVGTSGTTPSSIADIVNCRRVLNTQLAPKGPRALVIDGAAEANFLNLALFTSRADSDRDTLISGELGERFGFTIVHDQNIEGNSFTTGTQNGAYVTNGVQTIGKRTQLVATGTGTMVVGDIFTVAGDTQQYAITTAYAGGAGTIAFYPGAARAWAGGAAITFRGNHAQTNIAFHRDAISLAVRPLVTPDGFGVISASEADPISGLVLRLEVERVHKATVWSWDILWGIGVTRREFGTRLLG